MDGYDGAQDLNTPLGLALTAGIALQSDYFASPTQNDRVPSLKISFSFRYFY